MLEELEFKIGEPGQLAGRCVLYAVNAAGTENPFNPHHPALAVAADPGELLKILSSIMPLTDEMRDNVMAKLRESTEMWTRTMFGQQMYRTVRDIIEHHMDDISLPDNLKEQIQEEMAGIPDEQTGTPFHGCFVPLIGFDPDIIEPYKALCDVVCAPEVPNISYAGLVLAGHAQHYLATYFMQHEHDLDGRFSEGESEMPSFSDISRSEFLELLDRKLSELMYVRETGGESRPLLRDLHKLTSGTYFVRDVLNLSNLLETNHPRKIELMGLYLQRIHLLVNEKYEEIPVLDQQIRALDSQAG